MAPRSRSPASRGEKEATQAAPSPRKRTPAKVKVNTPSKQRKEGSSLNRVAALTTFLSPVFAYDSAFRTWVFPLFLILSFPVLAILLVSRLIGESGGNLTEFLSDVYNAEKPLDVVFLDFPRPSWDALRVILLWVFVQLVLLVGIPAKRSFGPLTHGGVFKPEYRLNGVPAYFITQSGIIFAWYFGWFSAAHIVRLFGAIISTLSVTCFVLVLALLLKAHVAPTHVDLDSTPSGNPIWDYFWGIELYPAVAGVSLKQLVNCRVSMNAWAALPIVFALAQAEIYGNISYNITVSALLVNIYLLKFFIWEDGYFNSIDIIHDRFGFYIFWGCMVWVPSAYSSFAWYMLHHRSPAHFVPYGSAQNLGGESDMQKNYSSPSLAHYTPLLAALNLLLGIVAIALNYWSDVQRQEFRNTNKVWGVAHPKYVLARYTLADGVLRQNKMLVSGWWSLARHINYVFELSAALLWCAPAGVDHIILPYFYFIFLFILLVDRQGRDEIRMRLKYGSDWERVCKRVPYKILPYIY